MSRGRWLPGSELTPCKPSGEWLARKSRAASALVPGLFEDLQSIVPAGWVLKQCRCIQEALTAFPDEEGPLNRAGVRTHGAKRGPNGKTSGPVRPIALTPAAGFTVRTAAVDLGTKGFRFLRCLRTAMPDLPILALSNEVDGPGAVKTLMEGASGHLCRPFSPKGGLGGGDGDGAC